MKGSTVFDCQIFQLPKVSNPAGNLTSINGLVNVPFEIKRVYYLYDLPAGETRGGHAHYNLSQLIVSASGSFDVLLSDSVNTKIVTLNRPFYGLFIPPGIWRELINFSGGSISLVMASELYREDDYIRDKTEFCAYKRPDAL